VLVEHLKRGGYHDRTMEGLARALAVRPAVYSWDTLKELYLTAEGPGEETGLAVALAACATSAQVDALIALVHDDTRSDRRLFFLQPIKKLGGPAGLKILEALRDDPVFGIEATRLLKKRNPRPRRAKQLDDTSSPIENAGRP
jgi:hypothetical protein